MPEGIAKNTITVPYNDLDALKIAFEKFGDDIAGVIVEPVAGNMVLYRRLKVFYRD